MAKVLHGGETNEQLVVTTDKTQAYGLAGNDTISNSLAENVLIDVGQRGR